MLTRRRALAGLAATAWSGKVRAQSGPDADLYGAEEGYPVPPKALAQ